jgi:hypothetical protein
MPEDEPMGFEELLGRFFNWIGLDFSAMSRPRMIAAIAVYALFILLLLTVGIVIIEQGDTAAIRIIGAIIVLFGLGVLTRVAINLSAIFRSRTGAA